VLIYANYKKNKINYFLYIIFRVFFTYIIVTPCYSVPPFAMQSENYINYDREIPSLNLSNTTSAHVKKIIRSLAPKFSSNGSVISTKMIKFLGEEISTPLAHIFNLSLRTGSFPKCFKQCRVIPIF